MTLQQKQVKSKKESKPSLGYYAAYLAVCVALVALFYGGSQVKDLETFKASFHEKICQSFASSKQEENHQEKPQETEEFNENVLRATKKVTKQSLIDPTGSNYNAKRAMDARYRHLTKQCQKYADIMRPESKIREHIPERTNFAFRSSSNSKLALCKVPGVASGTMEYLSNLSDQGDAFGSVGGDRKGFYNQENKGILKGSDMVVLVRHPLERLVSVYRSTFDGHYDASSKKQIPPTASFSEFADIVVEGYSELAKFFDENKMEGQSLGLDTGMVDGKGKSKKWDTVWRLCGLCQRDHKPKYILHLDHYKDDMKVLQEIMRNPVGSDSMVNTSIKPKSQDPELLEYYYSQLTKSQIRGLEEKYKMDLDLLGFSAEYFIQFGKGE